MNKEYYLYIMTNKMTTNKESDVLYVGVTNDLEKRVARHKQKMLQGFTSRYNVNKLVYYETCSDINSIIAREKQIKGGSRQKKIDLIESMNPNWDDLTLSFNEIASPLRGSQ